MPRGEAAIVFVPHTLSFEIEDPGPAEIWGSGRFPESDLSLISLQTYVRGSGSPSVTWSIRFSGDRNAAGTEIITGGTTTTSLSGQFIDSFTVSTIPAGNWIWLLTTAQSGTVLELVVGLTVTGNI